MKSGGDFTTDHVEWLYRQCLNHMPGWGFRCWSDVMVPREWVRLRHDWPKWWAKMQIYEDTWGAPYPTLVIDLDTIFLKTFDILPEHADKAIFIRDPWKNGFRHPERLAGGFMYLPTWARKRILQAWNADTTIGDYDGDDQPFLHSLFKDDALRFQDHYIDQIVSYKVHVKAMGVQPDNRVVYFHGQPRPWDLKESWIPCLPPDLSSLQVA
jgi:hypothetical protein